MPTPKQIIAACGNDCAMCPRYTAPPFEKTEAELRRTAELWQRIGYRDRVVSVQEISCGGCGPNNWCRYNVIQCAAARKVATCGDCAEYPCDLIRACFEATQAFEPHCRKACADAEYEALRRAFYEKRENLDRIQRQRAEDGRE